MRTRFAGALPVLVALALLPACGGDDDEAGAGSTSSASTSSATTSSAAPPSTGAPGSATPSTGAPGSGTPSTDDDSTDAPPFPANTEPDTGTPSADALVTVTGIRTGRHDGFDRVVFDVEGRGTPGWDVRYVDEARSQGSGAPLEVEGDAVLQVTLSGVGYPTDTGIEEYDGAAPLPGNGTETVTEVVWDTTFEGTSVAFVGLAERTPFRVYLLEQPTRVVLDVVHPR
jgi:hypothetical protein